ncbi:GNAT family N-acetyltransferase [Candidatus Bipolaricaulota bacterium]
MKAPQLNDLIIRPATQDDLNGVCEVIRAYSVDMFGVENDAKRNVEMTWGQPGFQVDTDTRVVATPAGRIVGYGEVEDTQAPHVRIGCWSRVHPEYRGLGLGARLLDWIEKRAREAIDRAPDGTRVTLSHGVPDADLEMQRLFKDHDFSVVRHFWRMTIELDHGIPEPVWPDGVSVRTFMFEEDLESVVHAFRDSFQDHWGYVEKSFEEDLKEWDYWIRSDEEFDETLTFLAMAGDKVVGLSSCDPKHPEDPNMGLVEVLGVRRAWRRKGIALALLHHTFLEFHRRGQKRVGLGVDATSLTGANKLYAAAGMKPTRQTDFVEKELRPGIDLSLQSLNEESDLS